VSLNIGLVREARVCEAAEMLQQEEKTGFVLVTVASGARSLHSLEHGETFHPVVGPMAEAHGLHVEQSRIAERARECTRRFVIWDVGLGAAANAVAVLEALSHADCAARVELHSFDSTTEPFEFALRHADELEYLMPWREPSERLLQTGRALVGLVEWHLHRGDFRDFVRTPQTVDAPDAILYDPYSPEVNPGMWTLEHLTNLRGCLDAMRPCTLTSYSRSTAVRVTLVLAGFFTGRGGAIGEKDQTTVAATHRELLAQPLDAEWLGRVVRSTRGAPRREGAEGGPISAEDFAALRGTLA
jgi:tRNA U34 5-methylaminomethyl-2-thiouridine-forming methyltransferase MnmC